MVMTRTIEELVAALNSCTGIIAIDGTIGAGKSCLARDLAERLGAGVLEVDDYLSPPGPGEKPDYLPRLQYERILGAVPLARPLIIDSLCVRGVLARTNLQADRHVYVRALHPNGSWRDETICDVTRIREADEKGVDQGLDDLRTEIRDYHREYDPVANADIIFERRKEWLTREPSGER